MPEEYWCFAEWDGDWWCFPTRFRKRFYELINVYKDPSQEWSRALQIEFVKTYDCFYVGTHPSEWQFVGSISHIRENCR